MMASIFDSELSSVTRVDLYRSQVAPDLYPRERAMRVELWHPEDQAAYVGGEYAQ